jgi:ribosomal-protein-alanine N-acetyltransferase
MLENLETPRLYLRKMTVADANEVFENWTSSEKVAKYLTWAPPHFNRSD